MSKPKKKTKYETHYKDGGQAFRRRMTMPDGSVRNVYAKSKDELDKKWAALLAEVEAIKKGGAMRAKSPTVAVYAEKQLRYLKASVSYATYIGYESKAKKYIIGKFAPDKLLCDVTPDDIREATVGIGMLSKSTCDSVSMLYKLIFRRALAEKLIDSDPTADLVIRSKQPQNKKHALSDEEVEILLAAVNGLPVEPFIRIALETGMRREEILGLQWDAVFLDIEYPYVEVKRAWRIEHNRPVVSDTLKTPASARKIPISDNFAGYLRNMKDNASPDSVFVISNSDGGALTGSQWRNLWKYVTRRMTKPHNYVRYVNGEKHIYTVTPETGKTAKHNPDVVYSIPFDVTPHQLRHTAITNWVHRGYDVKVVQYLAGHENIKITLEVYADCKYNTPQELGNVMFGKRESKSPSAVV